MLKHKAIACEPQAVGASQIGDVAAAHDLPRAQLTNELWELLELTVSTEQMHVDVGDRAEGLILHQLDQAAPFFSSLTSALNSFGNQGISFTVNGRCR